MLLRVNVIWKDERKYKATKSGLWNEEELIIAEEELRNKQVKSLQSINQ